MTKIQPDGASLIYSTYLGGSSADQLTALRADPTGSVTLTGNTGSADFPLVAAFQPRLTGEQDGFVARVDPKGGSLIFSSFVAGTVPFKANAVALDSVGDVYIAGSRRLGQVPDLPSVFKLSNAASPASVLVTFNSVPSGLMLTIDGATVATPKVFAWAPGVTHTIDVPSPQAFQPGPKVGNFAAWSIAGPKSQTITTPVTATTFTAVLDTQTCAYAFAVPAARYGQYGLFEDYVDVVTQQGCPLVPVSSSPWIPVSSQPIGPGTVHYKVLPNTTGGTRSGTITVGTAAFSITQGFTAPTVSFQRHDSTGLAATFAYRATDLDGVTDLTVSNLLINSALDGRRACYLAFDHAARILYLVDDAGISIRGMKFDSSGRGTGTLSNSQCTVDGINSYFGAAETNSDVHVALTFNASFGGNKVVYVAARDSEGLNSGWQGLGVWNVPATVTFPNVSPLWSGSSFNVRGTTDFEVTYQDAISQANLTPSQILINASLDGRGACYLGYDHKNNLLYLVDDAGTALLPAITPAPGGSIGVLQNSQCIVSSSGSYGTGSEKEYILHVRVVFRATFTGPKIVYGATQTTQGGNSGWKALGTIVVMP